MKRLQAAMRDRAASSWREKKTMYKVGSYFKGCQHCGETEEVEVGTSGGTALRYLTGLQVFRSYVPASSGWTYWCWECGAKDAQCWSDAIDIGVDAIVGSRDSVKARKAEMRKHAVRNDSTQRLPSRKSQIAELEAELERLMEMLKGGK